MVAYLEQVGKGYWLQTAGLVRVAGVEVEEGEEEEEAGEVVVEAEAVGEVGVESK